MSKVYTELLSISYPSLPFFDFVPEGVCVGTVIYFEGHIPENCDKFNIDLIDGQNINELTFKQSDIPIEISFRFDKNLLVRNTRRDGEWGRQEISGLSPIKTGDDFQMEIVVEDNKYLVKINGNQLEYQHRMSSDRAKLLRIDGCVDLHRVEFRHGKHYHKNQLNYFDDQ